MGEVGVQGVNWDLDHHSQDLRPLSANVQTLSQEGVLIGVVSKNDPAVVEEAFRREDLILSKESISMLNVSWGSKAKAVSQILEVWNVGADSVVFMDDSPSGVGRSQGSAFRYRMHSISRGRSQAIYELLVHLRDLFGKGIISEEDQLRQESIRHSATLRQADDGSEGFSEVLLEQAEAG